MQVITFPENSTGVRIAVIALGLAAVPGALAYVGPGAGLGLLAALAAVIGAVLLTIVGLFLWPLRALARRRKAAEEPDKEENEEKED